MKRLALLFLAVMALGAISAEAQKKKAEVKAFEEATARKLDPEVRVFIRPMVCDMQMLTTERETFGPYPFPIKSLEQTSDLEFRNHKSRAMYQASKEADADAIMEPIFHSYVNEKEPKIMYIELSGYPVKYTNFHPLRNDEIEMVEKIYTRTTDSRVDKSTPEVLTVGEQKAGK